MANSSRADSSSLAASAASAWTVTRRRQFVEGRGERGQFGGGGGHGPIMASRAGTRHRGAGWASGSIDGPWPCDDSTSAASTVTVGRSPTCCPVPWTSRTARRTPWPAILAEVRAEGDSALRRLTAQFDRVDVEELRVPAIGDLRRAGPHPGTPPGGARRRPRPDPGLPLPRGVRRPGRLHQRRRDGAPPDPTGGPGRVLRPGWAGPVPVDRPHVRGAGPRGRSAGDRPVRPPGTGRSHRRRHPGGRRRGRGDRGLRGGRGPGHRGDGLRDREHRRRRRDRRPRQPLRGRGQATGVRCRGRRLGVRRTLRGGRDRRPRHPVGAGRHRPGGAGRARSRRSGLADHLVGGAHRPGRRRRGPDRGRLPASVRPRGHPRVRGATPCSSTARRRPVPWPTWSPPSTSRS